MAQVELLLPKMGESVAEATILKWLKKPGDRVEMDENVLEIATDKVDSEVPSPVAGTLAKCLYEEGQVIKVGAPIAIIDTEGGAGPSENGASRSEAPKAAPQPQPASQPKPQPSAPAGSPAPLSSGDRFYSPLVRNIARSENISMEQLDSIPGSGKDGRLTKEDLLAWIRQKSQPKQEAKPQDQRREEQPQRNAPEAQRQAEPQPEKPRTASVSGDVEVVEMNRMRKLIAEHMVMSKHTSPHVTSFVEADVTNLVMWRERIKKEFEKREKEKITFTPVFIEIIARAIKDFPMINVSVDGNNILVKKNINIGMAVALPSGNLIVPVIRKADQLNLVGLTKTVNDIANRARINKLSPEEIQGGTFTLTNVGGFGNLMGTPIINQPQVAIIATGAIKKKPAVIETPQGDAIAIRHMMFLSLSYDHRVVDGSLGGMFLRRVADYLEQFDPNRPV